MATPRRAPARSTAGVPIRPVVVLATGLFGIGAAVGGYGTYVTALVARGVDPAVAGGGMSLFLLGQVLVVLPADRLTRSWSPVSVAAVGFLVGALGAAFGGWLSVPAALASRTLLGFGQAIAFIGAMKVVARRTRGADTATAQGLLGAGFTLGFAVGMATTPLLFDVNPAVPALAAGAAIVVGLVGAAAFETVGIEPVQPLAAYLDAVRSPMAVMLGLGNMAAFGFMMVAGTWYSELLASIEAVATTSALVGFALATVVGRSVGGFAARQIGAVRTVGWSLAALAVFLGVIAVAVAANATLVLLAGVVLTGLAFGMPFGPLFSLAFTELSPDAGVTLVGMLAIGNLGALIFPWLVGRLLAATASFAPGFLVMALTVVLITVGWSLTIQQWTTSSGARS